VNCLRRIFCGGVFLCGILRNKVQQEAAEVEYRAVLYDTRIRRRGVYVLDVERFDFDFPPGPFFGMILDVAFCERRESECDEDEQRCDTDEDDSENF
jgi:hypothetical protein